MMPRHFRRDDDLAPPGQAEALDLAGNRRHAPKPLLAWLPERAA
jgi:hypothetical protein